jgi:hypothetical protein
MSTVDVLAVHTYFTEIEHDLHHVDAHVILTDLELCCCTL